MLPPEAGDLSLLQDNGGEGEIVASAPPTNVAARYIPLKAGRYPLKIVRSADPKTPLKTVDLVLRQDVFVTFVAYVKDKALAVEMIDDTFDPTVTTAGKLTIHHFLPGARITIAATANAKTGTLTEGTTEVLENLPLRPLMVQMKAALPDGQVREWTAEANFKLYRHASVLLVLDPYGRFRPRIVVDGQTNSTAPE